MHIPSAQLSFNPTLSLHAIKQTLMQILTALFLLLNIQLAWAVELKPIRFAPLPMESLDTMTREYLPFMDFLEKRMNTPFEMVYHRSYQTLIAEFLEGRIDIAYLGPLPYVALKEQFPDVTPVAQFLDESGLHTYTCAMVRFADQDINLSSDQLKQVALTQPLSTCGYLAVESILQNRNLSLEDGNFEYQYLESHESVALNVILGNYNIGGLKTKIGKKYQHLGLRIMEETEPMPGFLLVANKQTLSADFINEVRRLILSLNPLEKPHDQEVTRSWGPKIKNGAIEVKDSDYDIVREKWKKAKTDLIQHP